MPTLTLEELLEEVKFLKANLSAMEEQERLRQKKEYDQAYFRLRRAILKTLEIENVIENTHEKLGITDLLTDLLLINNPYSDKLGFRFADVIEDKVKEILLSSLPDSKDENQPKNRFLRIIKKVIDNPITDMILNINPVGAVVGNVINTATNLIDTTWEKVEETRIGNGLKKIALTTIDEINSEKLQLFQDSIEKYSKFYSEMLAATQRFDTKIDILKSSFKGVFLSYKDLNLSFIKAMRLDPNNPFESLDILFEKQNQTDIDFQYQAMLDKTEVQKGLEFLISLPDVEAEARKYSDEFASTFKTFIEEYVNVLQTPINDNWSSGEIDAEKINEVINKLKSYLATNIMVTAIPEHLSGSNSMALVTFNEDLTKFVA